MKICNRCKLKKQNTDFYKNPYSKDRLKSICKSCCKEYATSHKEDRRQKSKLYLEAHPEAKDKKRRQSRKWSDNNRDRVNYLGRRWYMRNRKNARINYRKNVLKHRYGLSLEDYANLLKIQNNKCAICGMTTLEYAKNFHVDHCHKTTKIRGLLCYKCNMVLGYFKDNVDLFLKAIDYLKKHSK